MGVVLCEDSAKVLGMQHTKHVADLGGLMCHVPECVVARSTCCVDSKPYITSRGGQKGRWGVVLDTGCVIFQHDHPSVNGLSGASTVRNGMQDAPSHLVNTMADVFCLYEWSRHERSTDSRERNDMTHLMKPEAHKIVVVKRGHQHHVRQECA